MPVTPERGALPAETILAFDFGLRRIGVAVGQSVTASASPAGVVANRADGPDFDAIGRVIDTWHPARLVVGLPMNADGTRSEMQDAVDAFAAGLGRFGVPVELVDERHTSQEATARLKQARAAGRRRVRKEHVDATAAVMIAERYLAGMR